MGVADSDPNAIHSSIALLQERFKQLHREKKLREERELLRLFSDSPESFGATHSTSQYINHASKRRRLFHSEILLTDKQPLKALSLWPSSTTNCQTELWDVEAPKTKKMRSEDRDKLPLRDSSFQSGHFENDIVDTSLHL